MYRIRWRVGRALLAVNPKNLAGSAACLAVRAAVFPQTVGIFSSGQVRPGETTRRSVEDVVAGDVIFLTGIGTNNNRQQDSRP